MAKTCLEVGCSDFNNLAHFVDHGWDVFMVEPVPRYAESLRSKYPGATVVEAAISNVNGTLPMAVFNTDRKHEWMKGISHLDVKEASGLVDRNAALGSGTKQVIEVEALTLDTLLSVYNINDIEYLQIDVEGHELVILENYSWRIKPKYLKVEHKFIDDNRLAALLTAKNYHVSVERDDVYAVLL